MEACCAVVSWDGADRRIELQEMSSDASPGHVRACRCFRFRFESVAYRTSPRALVRFVMHALSKELLKHLLNCKATLKHLRRYMVHCCKYTRRKGRHICFVSNSNQQVCKGKKVKRQLRLVPETVTNIICNLLAAHVRNVDVTENNVNENKQRNILRKLQKRMTCYRKL